MRFVLGYANKVLNREDETKRELLQAVEDKKKAWEELKKAKLCTPRVPDDITDLKLLHDGFCELERRSKALVMSKEEQQRLKSISQVIEDINTSLEKSMGTYEALLERKISEDPINAEHNPFYGGAFNGNDCVRLVLNHGSIFDAINKSAEHESNQTVKEDLLDVSRRFKAIFAAFAEVVPTYCSTEKLVGEKKAELLESIDNFWETYHKNCSGSVTLKIHHMVSHTKLLLGATDAVGLWAEDSVESIHAIVNSLTRQYATLDGSRRAKQVFRAVYARQEAKEQEDVRNKKGKGRKGGEKEERTVHESRG